MDKKLVITLSIIFIVIMIIIMIYRSYTKEYNRQKNQPVFISNIRNAKTKEKYSGKKLTNSVDGIAATYSVWLNINDWSYRKDEFKHVFHIGYQEAPVCSPGVWITPNTNNIVVRYNTNKPAYKFNVRSGYPSYLENLMGVISTINSNDYILVKNIPTSSTMKSKTYKEIILENNSTKEIIFFVKEGNSMNHDTVPLQYLLMNNISEISQNLNPSSSYPFSTDINGNINKMDIYTLNLTDEKPSLNPEKETLIDTSEQSFTIENVPLSRWFNLIITVNEHSINFYIDSIYYGSLTFSNELSTPSGDIYSTMNGGFGGMISQLRYFNYTLSSKEIELIYYKGPDGRLFPSLDMSGYDFLTQTPAEEDDCAVPTMSGLASHYIKNLDTGIDNIENKIKDSLSQFSDSISISSETSNDSAMIDNLYYNKRL